MGNRPDFIQGVGGNMSAKVDRARMLIKASGYRLSEVGANDGLVMLDYPGVKNYYENIIQKKAPLPKEDMEIIRSFVLEKTPKRDLRPSMETGFHAFLGKYVLHTHSVYVNLVACALGGYELLKDILGNTATEFAWVSYKNPGTELAVEIGAITKEHRDKFGKNPKILILQNHGLIVSGESAEEILGLHKRINERVMAYFKLEAGSYSTISNNNQAKPDKFSEIVLFPDQIIFAEDNFSAWRYLITMMEKLKLRPNVISENNQKRLLGMDFEKYRRELSKNNN